MYAIFIKELQSFFYSPLGYLILILFLAFTGLFLWVLPNDFNIFSSGFADLHNFFLLLPWIFLFLIPAVTMRSLAEENKMGTLELLLIKPIPLKSIVIAKFLGAFSLCLIALLPTLLYIFIISALGMTTGNYDLGVVIGSYFGTLFLIGLYTAIGIFCSALSNNQIVAFLSATVLCFVLLYIPDMLSEMFRNGGMQQLLQNLGARVHFNSIAQGILDSRDIIYFLSLTVFFLVLTVLQMKKKNTA
ncbi:MAG: gliding motility-associated ABC transporter permease subunit GldF [Bacteroidota bacterium]